MSNRAVITGLIAIVAAAGASTALGHGMFPTMTPVDRIVTNLESYVKAHPEDAEGYYRLGRAHYLALTTKRDQIRAMQDRDAGFEPAEGAFALWRDGEKSDAKPLTPEALKGHLAAAVRNLNKAIELKPGEAKYHLTLACALEAGAEFKKDLGEHPLVMTNITAADIARMGEFVDREIAASLEAGSETESLGRMLEGGSWWSTSRVRDYIIARLYPHRNDEKSKVFIRAILDADWDRQVLDEHFRAICLALEDDSRATEHPVWGGLEDYVAYEAATNFVRVVGARSGKAKEPVRLAVAEATVKSFKALPPPSAITPIVFSMTRPGRRLADLVSDDRGGGGGVEFDLDASGTGQRWSWVKPETGILCWDPARTGKITSGHQLFGSVSWKLFFDNGYEALDLLDDDRDGRLAGKELAGISVWFDRNSNGVSDPGEVTPVDSLGVAAIACRATGADMGCPANLNGLTLKDGTVLPTFDWVAHRKDEGVKP